ncbi:MAG: twin-arginine translocation signal domain-containing protein, partial [Pirellulaceae bacterium]|nr:twin-arginine translocation signal domain-containing protein [Pirellulaceae bacterium]
MNNNVQRTPWLGGETSRRDFLKAPLVAGAAGAVLSSGSSFDARADEGESTNPAAETRRRVIDEYDPNNIKIARRVSANISDDDLLLLKQIGLRWAGVSFGTNQD